MMYGGPGGPQGVQPGFQQPMGQEMQDDDEVDGYCTIIGVTNGQIIEQIPYGADEPV